MKEQLSKHIESYLQSSKSKNIRLSADGSQIYIKTSLFSYQIYNDLILSGALVYWIYTIDDKAFFLIPFVFAFVVLIIIFWNDFRSINNITINLISNTIEVKSRNLFKRLFLKYILKKETAFDFNKINAFIVKSNDSFQNNFLRYYIKMKLIEGDTLTLTNFTKEEQANSFVAFLNHLLKN